MSVVDLEILELQEKIQKLKRTLNAVILAHNYQRPEVQDVADFSGDSLDLSRQATKVEAEVIVFCGVHFMAENAAILNPTRTVLLPEALAGCPMADMITVEDLREWKEDHPDAVVVCYVNSSAAVKAESDICCTSANAVKVVESVDRPRVLFVPDEHLGRWVSRHTKKGMILYPGFCPTHLRLRAQDILAAKERYPGAMVIVHPECSEEVVDLADAVLSTSQMLRYVKQSEGKVFLVGTEAGILHRMQKENPDKIFYSASSALLCPNMKMTRLQSVVEAMERGQHVITVPEEIRIRAKQALDRMLAVV
ncbi:MAG: quinolinate synthase NadA [Chloroflexi bacterium]|nr:quinolinate synthase NadA [Chloroflexota bacterium]MCL5075501.1 quinolinate synthase NadA [Chloroflexota bacterium]